MKKIKRIILVLMIIVCSGCTIDYDLEIKENEVIEEIMVNDTLIFDRTSSDIMETYNTWMPVYSNINNPDLIQDGDDGKIDGIEYHEKDITKKSDGYYYTYKYIYPFNDFKYANSLRLAFGNPSFYDAGSYINIRTDNINALCNYNYFESLDINIKVDLNAYKVDNSNASSVKGNVYTWHLDRNNCNDSIISLKLNKINNTVVSTTTSKRTGGDIKKPGGLNNYVMYIFAGVMILVILLGYRWFNKMKERENGVDD